jgi:plasmid stabilization system protein ParE
VSDGYVFTRQAEEDLLGIWRYYVDVGGETTADRVIARIYSGCQKLSEMPGIGHYREDLLDKRHRFWCVRSYLIVYRWKVKPIQIIAVVYGARDLGAFFRDRP